MKHTKKSLSRSLLNYVSDYGRLPTSTEWETDPSRASLRTVRRHYGNWNSFLKETTGEINRGREGTFCVICSNCQTQIKRKVSEKKKSKSGLFFCCGSCRTSYQNRNKTHGTNRSKLEVWLEEKLTELYPDLDIHFNDRELLHGPELDIYIPSMKLAFELNGIFHYEPIFGEEKLQSTQTNDTNKFQACQAKGISLCIIDTSSQKYFKPKTSQKFLDIITKVIKNARCEI